MEIEKKINEDGFDLSRFYGLRRRREENRQTHRNRKGPIYSGQ